MKYLSVWDNQTYEDGGKTISWNDVYVRKSYIIAM
jgi:hypothetical protein